MGLNGPQKCNDRSRISFCPAEQQQTKEFQKFSKYRIRWKVLACRRWTDEERADRAVERKLPLEAISRRPSKRRRDLVDGVPTVLKQISRLIDEI